MLTGRWDDLCSTERNFDHLILSSDEQGLNRLPIGPQGNGMFTGPNSDGWHQHTFEIIGNRFYWKWHTDGK
jgi:hypothetical protein